MAGADREAVREAAREGFSRIARGAVSERFRLDYGIFLDDPARARALADEAVHIATVLGGGDPPGASSTWGAVSGSTRPS